VILALVVGLAGAGGAVSRFVVDGAIQHRSSGTVPFGTLSVNFAGSLVMGFLTGMLVFSGISKEWVSVIGTGFCGGLTTWSAASWETVRLLEEREFRAGSITVLGSLVGGFLLAGCGFLLARAVGG
jgi:fluoride exporter